jgi:glycosyltransferase involved in cell wall biosynthesis
MVFRCNILICIPVLLLGGTEIQTLYLVRILVEAGYRVTVCCYYEFDNSVLVHFKEAGADVILLRLDRSNRRFGANKIFELIRTLVAIFREYRPDIVHVQYIAPGLIPISSAKLSGLKTVFATVHQPGRTYGWKPKLLIHIAASLCNAFFCNSKAVEESWFGDSQIFNPEKIDKKRKHFTIYNGVDVDRIERIAKEADTERIRESLNIGNKKVVGVVGRLRSEKGQAVLLKAMVDVINVIPDAVLLVVGDGPDRQHLEQLAIQFGINSHVLWLGQRKQEEVFELYSIMDVVAVPSIFEGFGLAAAEAMAVRRPVVGTRVDGLTEIIEESVTGYLVPVNNSGELAQALIKLLNNPERARTMGLNGAERVKKMFSLEQFSESTLAAYRYFTGL